MKRGASLFYHNGTIYGFNHAPSHKSSKEDNYAYEPTLRIRLDDITPDIEDAVLKIINKVNNEYRGSKVRFDNLFKSFRTTYERYTQDLSSVTNRTANGYDDSLD